MAAIRKRGGKYFLDYRVNGKRVRKVVGNSLEEAQQALVDLGKSKSFSRQGVGFQQIRQEFVTHIEKELSLSTRTRYQSILNNFQTFLKVNQKTNKDAVEFNQALFVTYIQYRQNRGAHARTINAELTVLRLLFRLAVKWDFVDTNPLQNIKNLTVEKNQKISFLSSEQVNQLLAVCDSETYPIIYTFLKTGLRKSELEGLRWSAVDFEKRILMVGQRCIPLSEKLVQLLQEQIYQSKGSDYVFPDGQGNAFSSSRLHHVFKSLIKRSGIQGMSQLSVLRHTFAANLLSKGASISTLNRIMNYSTANALILLEQLEGKTLDEIIEEV